MGQAEGSLVVRICLTGKREGRTEMAEKGKRGLGAPNLPRRGSEVGREWLPMSNDFSKQHDVPASCSLHNIELIKKS